MSWFRKDKAGTQESTAARERAVEDLQAASARWPEVMRLSNSLRGYRERNHFAEQIQTLFQGGRP